MQILRADGETKEDAQIILLTAQAARDKIDNLWWNDADLSADAASEADHHWQWASIAARYHQDNLHACVAVLSQRQYIEGAMAYQFNAPSKLEADAGSVYVGWLASAPINRPWLVREPFYRGIGSVLLYRAVRESYVTGLGGRVSLQSLPTPSTLQFYKHKGFVRTDLSQPLTGLIDYEIPATAAIAWLRAEGDLP